MYSYRDMVHAANIKMLILFLDIYFFQKKNLKTTVYQL
jgi:hypothetical protein